MRGPTIYTGEITSLMIPFEKKTDSRLSIDLCTPNRSMFLTVPFMT